MPLKPFLFRSCLAAAMSLIIAADAGAGALGVDHLLVLQSTPEVRAPDSLSEAERDMLRIEYRTLTALHEQADNQLELAETLRHMLRDARELKAAGELLGVRAAVAPAAEPVVILASAPAEKIASAVPLVAAAEPPLVELRAIPIVGPEAPPPESSDDWGSWLFYAGLGVALLLVLGLVMRRRHVANQKVHGFSLYPPTIIVDDELGFSRPAEEVMAATVTVIDPTPVMPRAQDISSLSDKSDVSPVIEIAEIMLSFGRVKGAAQALQEYIQANPREALQPWIRLLEIYRGNGMRSEFESLATNLNQNFNVEIVHWDNATPGERLEMTLELLPHIRDQIDALWGSPECFEYLQKLLHDNREGQRNGFALPVVKEILVLIDLMVAEKAAA
jgi:hypothetical protein